MKKIIAISVMTVFSAFSCNNSITSTTSPKVKERISSAEVESLNISDEDIVLTMAISGENPYIINGKDVVKEFNNADNGYKIIFKDYAEDIDKTIENSEETLNNYNLEVYLDIMDGGNVDIIPNIFTDRGKFFNLAEKGAFLDLNTFLDKDSEINHDTLFDSVLQACEMNNKLTYMPLCFSIDTLAGPTKYVGDKENWTFDEMKEHWEKMPDGSTINWHTVKDYVYFALLRGVLSGFIDYDNAECYFDSKEFIDILDFINSFEDFYGDKEDIGYDSPLFLFEDQIYSFRKFHYNPYRENYGTDEALTYVGYPSEDKNGSYFNVSTRMIAISNNSSAEKKRGAWEFIRILLSYENQYKKVLSDEYSYNSDNDLGFPVNKKAFEDMGKDQYSHQNESNIVDKVEGEINEGYLTKAEYDKLADLINNTHKVNMKVEDDIYTIINDEIYAMFRGEKTSQQIAENIQNRVQLLVSERS